MSTKIAWDIIPGKSMGKFILGLNLEELKKLIDFNYEIKEDLNHGIITLHNEMIEFITHKENNEYILIQIVAKGEFPGKFQNLIGIGTILAYINENNEYIFDEEMLSNYHNYYIISTKHSGITFITEKPWDMNTPIVRITIENVN